MKLKHIIPALFGLSACFACSSTNLVNNNKTNMAPQSGGDNPINYLKITFDLNGGTYQGSSDPFVMENVLPTSYWKYLADKAPGSSEMPITYPNRNFIGYSFSKDDKTNIIEPTYIVKDSIYVYAQYEPDATKDCVVEWYDGSTRLGQPETYVVGETPTFKGTTPIHQGEVFTGWDPEPQAITQDQADAGVIVKYNAVYLPLTQGFTVTLNYNNGSQNIHTQHVEEGGKATEPTITYPGHTLFNWTYVGGTHAGETFNFATTITEDISIEANWTEDTYHITYVPNGGTLSSSDTEAKYHEAVTAPVLDNRPGYDKSLVKWYKKPDFSGSEFVFGVASDIESDITLYAKWPGISQVTVTFNGNGGTWEAATSKEITIDYGTKVYPPADPTLANNTFIGWYNQATGGSAVDFSTPITQNIEVFAHWKVTTYHSVTFDTQGGNSITGQTIAHGSTASKPADNPVKDGYTFINWYDQATGGNVWKFTETAINNNVTIYAHWSDIKVNHVYFVDDDGETLIEDVPTNYGDKVTRPENPTKEHYTFKEWTLALGEDEPFDFDTPITKETVLFALYDVAQYHIRWFNPDASRTLLYDSYVEDGEIPVYEGNTPTMAPDLNHRYAFTGWSPLIYPADSDMSYFATYDYDDDINFSYISNEHYLDDQLSFTTTVQYGGTLAYKFEETHDPEKLILDLENCLRISIDGGEKHTIDYFQNNVRFDVQYTMVYLLIDVNQVSSIKNAHSINVEAFQS